MENCVCEKLGIDVESRIGTVRKCLLVRQIAKLVVLNLAFRYLPRTVRRATNHRILSSYSLLVPSISSELIKHFKRIFSWIYPFFFSDSPSRLNIFFEIHHSFPDLASLIRYVSSEVFLCLYSRNFFRS